MVKIHFENLGNIAKGDVEINNFTIFAGSNNTGKTYVAYTLYSLFDKNFQYHLEELNPIIEKIYKDGFYELDLNTFFESYYQKMKQKLEIAFSKNLSLVFSANEYEFEKAQIQFELNETSIKKELLKTAHRSNINLGKKGKIVFNAIKEEDSFILKLILLDNTIPKELINDKLKAVLNRFIFNHLFSNAFLLPAERTGLNLFYKELSSKRTAIFHNIIKSETHTLELIKDLIISRYSQPIADYIDFLNNSLELKKLNSDFKDLAIEIQKNILNGKYIVETDGIYFIPYKIHSSNTDHFNQKISLHLSSSTVKTFFSLVFYLEHLAKEGETLIIDEPELNLHPDNQRKIAIILVMIANRGIKVIVSTHSDYFIREINNLIMLKNEFPSKNEIMQNYGYSENMLISDKQVNAYLFENNSIKLMEMDNKEGIIAKTFDDVINSLNSSSDDIYYQSK
ncbi:MAG: ABC transporter [Gammaproteobacteria bacterium]|nr:MAG: ABC transporter [Gammaproteobacteria bacterium]